MAVQFRDPNGFWKETGTVAAGAAIAGAVVGVAGLAGAPMEAAAGAAALIGGSVAAAVAHETPAAMTFGEKKPALRAVVGAIGGAIAGLGFAALSWRLNLGFSGVIGAGALGGLALGTLLSGDGVKHRASQLAGLVGATVIGAVGAAGLDNAARFAASEGAPIALTSTTLAGLLGLWIAAGAGLRRLQPKAEPMIDRANALLETLSDPVRTKVLEALAGFSELMTASAADSSMSQSSAEEAQHQAKLLMTAILDTAETWGQIHKDLKSPQVRSVQDKIKDLEARLKDTDDDVTKGHLQKALAALMAQQSAVSGLKVNLGRTEAALDAQLALLDRLRLAVVQHKVSDKERFAVELAAVAEQASRLSDDLESLSSAIAEAESLSDRRTLADLERDARKTMAAIAEEREAKAEVDAEVGVSR